MGIKRRKFLGIGLSGFAGFSLPRLFQFRTRAATDNLNVKSAQETTYWDRTDRFEEKLKLLENYWLSDNASNPADTNPILVMDMYEHAYQMDYGAAAPKYIDAYFANIHWDKAAARLST